MRYAEVAVNSPVAPRQTFSYSLPPGLDIEVGQAVWVPFGERVLQGIVLSFSPTSPVAATREIAAVIEARPVLSPERVSLARWLSDYYLSPLFAAAALMLPAGFERKGLTFISAAGGVETDTATLSPEQQQALALVRQEETISLASLERALGKKAARAAVSALVNRGLATRSYRSAPARVKPKTEPYLSLLIPPEQTGAEIERLRARRAGQQAALLELLVEQNQPTPWQQARQRLGIDRNVARALAGKGLITIQPVTVRRQPFDSYDTQLAMPLPLTPAQAAALRTIQARLQPASGGSPPVFLLHGVTGSGKTEVYLQALAEAVKRGRRGIVLVPEIALTPQTIERFSARFPRRVAVLHSQLSPGERFDEWHRIRDGECDVVIGSRSAIFAPQPELGLIIIDEEHEWTYKEADLSPHYHARRVAIRLAELTGAVVILGSATPDVETYYHCQQEDYRLLPLPERVTPGEGTLPRVAVVDMREELKAGNRSIFSRPLATATTGALERGEQVILFLNRRGGASFVQCRHCGLVLRCPRCGATLTQHPAEASLVCHQCNRRSPVPRLCPRCGSTRIKFIGAGTQKVEQAAHEAFPHARLLRWDSDTTRLKDAHRAILNRFRRHQADILIGTQMIAKGLDLPLVTLVGVVNADTGLNLPDFRAGERTFQLLSQVAGRAGRGTRGGQVIIQSYSPEHYAIRAAAGHDYALFYRQEIDYRRQLHYPPFSQLARLLYRHTSDHLCQREAERVKQLIIQERDSRGIADLSLIGPAPAFVPRLRGRYRWQLVLRGSQLNEFLSLIPLPQGWTVDIDPVGLV